MEASPKGPYIIHNQEQKKKSQIDIDLMNIEAKIGILQDAETTYENPMEKL